KWILLPLSWGSKIKKKLKTVAPYLGKFRPSIGQCCHQCTPDSLGKKLGQTIPSLGFQNLLSVNETHTRYRGWLVRRVCCVLLVRGCRVYPSSATDRVERVSQSNRYLCVCSSFIVLTYSYVFLWFASLSRLVGWVLLKVFGSVFCSVQVNLNHMAPLHRASKQGASLVYVCVPQSIVDYALIPLVLFCHNLRVPYTLCHLQIHNNWSVLQRLGMVLLPPDPITEQEAETDNLYSSVMTSLVGELLCEGQVLSVCVSGESWRGGQWLARIRLSVREGAVPDVHLVPVGISYDCVPNTSTPVGLLSALRCVFSFLCGNQQRSSVRIHFAQPFSLKVCLDQELIGMLLLFLHGGLSSLPCQSSHGFALDAVDTLVRCGILVMEEVPSDTPICDFWRKQGTLTWSASDDHSDCEEGDARSFKLSQPSQCPELLFFLCSLMAGYLRALCWATEGLDLLDTPLPEAVCLSQIHSHLCDTAQRDRGHYESCSEEVARVTVRTLTDLGVLVEDQQRGCVFLGVSPLFQQTDNRQKLHSFVSQFLYD
uniref:Glycerol-3-phosphate acyltransferase 2, mitochondrial n=1 Tax=Hucho hucho TaxID=62062 RepID=A0A4W5M380_9TELE